ncbi:DUF2809 domain-containing protein [Agromyces sp. G08B096]|uniref:DUF2809 domain-containing protein n=1 Tax=Agromyces sp. G08B096 TaxID=3156399 RepID=A0AAU7W5L8_9MICO
MPRPSTPARLRLGAAVAAVAVLAGGLALQLGERNAVIDAAGSMLYVVLVGLVVMMIGPRLAPWAVAVIALAVSVAIELLQLTGLPGAIVDAVPAARLVFGSSFDPWDLLAYLAGALLLWAIAVLIRRIAVRTSTG